MIKSVKLETSLSRVLIIFAGLFCLTMILFFVKWCFANAIASQAPSKEVARLAISLAPNDSQSHYALAVLDEKNFLPEELAESLKEFEQATALAPNDFRLWLAFGKARERRGDAAGAELALRKALELAPNYAQVQWTFGNMLLRRGKTVEGFAEIRKAAENDPIYRIPAISTAWEIFDDDFSEIRKSVGGTTKMDAALALFLAREKRLDEAFQVWSNLPAAEKKSALKTNGEELFGQMLAAKKYRNALQIQDSIEENTEAEKFAPGKIFNGGFEIDVKREKASPFDWQIADGTQPQIGFDESQKLGGKRSLVVIFNSADGRDFRQIAQIVVVEAGKKYAFETSYKADLKTSATLRWEISDAADGKNLAATNAIANVADWTSLKTEFVASVETQAVLVRLVRENCKSIICPITGKVWFDNFLIN